MGNSMEISSHRFRNIGLKIVIGLIALALVVYVGYRVVDLWRWNRLRACYKTISGKLEHGEGNSIGYTSTKSRYSCVVFTNEHGKWVVVYEKVPDRKEKRRVVFGRSGYGDYRVTTEVDEDDWQFLESVLKGCVGSSNPPPQNLGKTGAGKGKDGGEEIGR